MRTIYRLIWIPSSLVILGMTILFGVMPAGLPSPEPMKRYTSGDRSIRIQHPGNWKAHETSLHAVSTMVVFKPTREATMTISTDLQGSLMTDIMKSQASQMEGVAGMLPGGVAANAPKATPLQTMHTAQGGEMAADPEYPGFKDGAATSAQIGGKEAAITTFTWSSSGPFGSRPMVGRRVTMLSGDHNASVIYTCPKEMEREAMPVFDRMVSTLELDVQGPPR